MRHESFEAVVILGCRLRWTEGRLAGASGRRVRAGAELARELLAVTDSLRVIVSGGRSWEGTLEADAMKDELVRCGIGAARIDSERCSRSTKENARFVAAGSPARRVAVVTCDWHLPRALALFRAQGFEAKGFPASSGSRGVATRLFWWGRERLARTLDGV